MRAYYANQEIPLQTVQDDMVKHGWIPDDNCSIIIPVFEEYEYNKEGSGVLIKIDDKRNKKRKDWNNFRSIQ